MSIAKDSLGTQEGLFLVQRETLTATRHLAKIFYAVLKPHPCAAPENKVSSDLLEWPPVCPSKLKDVMFSFRKVVPSQANHHKHLGNPEPGHDWIPFPFSPFSPR